LAHKAMQDSVQICCNRCKGIFRDRARRVQNGYSRQCPSCEVILFFDDDSQQANIKHAMKTARVVRRQLRDSDARDVASPRGQAWTFRGRRLKGADETE
jgi:hypothetical protein